MRKRIDYKAHIINSLPVEDTTRYKVNYLVPFKHIIKELIGYELRDSNSKLISFSIVQINNINNK